MISRMSHARVLMAADHARFVDVRLHVNTQYSFLLLTKRWTMSSGAHTAAPQKAHNASHDPPSLERQTSCWNILTYAYEHASIYSTFIHYLVYVAHVPRPLTSCSIHQYRHFACRQAFLTVLQRLQASGSSSCIYFTEHVVDTK